LEFAIIRATKLLLRNAMRNMMDLVKIPADEPFVSLFVHYCNNFTIKINDSNWNSILKQCIREKFPGVLTEEESNPNFELLKSVDVRDIVFGLADQLGFTFESKTMKKFKENPADFVFLDTDIHSIIPKNKHTFLNYFYEGTYLLLTSAEISDQEMQSNRLTKYAYRNLLASCTRVNNCPVNNFFLANTLHDYAMNLPKTKKEKALVLYKQGDWAYEKASSSKSKCSGGLWSDLYKNWACLLFDYGHLLNNSGQKSEGKKMIEKAFEKLENSRKPSTANQFFQMLGALVVRDEPKLNKLEQCKLKKQIERESSFRNLFKSSFQNNFKAVF